MRLLLVLVLPFVSSCAAVDQELNQLTSTAGAAAAQLTPPRVDVANVTLVQRPSSIQLARALCPRVASSAICLLLGAPSPLEFVFNLQLLVHNDNTVPLPVVEALTAFTAFPDRAGGQNLGTVCISMCTDPNQCAPHANACSTTAPTIRTLQDFQNAAVGFLVAVATGQARLDNLRIKTIPAKGQAAVNISLALDPNQLLSLIEKAADQTVDLIRHGQAPALTIPYRVEGSVWMDVQSFGRIAAAFGPYNNSWVVQ